MPLKHNNRDFDALGSQFRLLMTKSIHYIKGQRFYLLVSGLVPIYIIFTQLINIYLIAMHRLPPPPPPGIKPSLIDVLTPPVVLLVLSAFALGQFFFLMKWLRLIEKFEKQSLIKNSSETNDQLLLTDLFYLIVGHMEKISKIFIIINVIFVFYLNFFLRFVFHNFIRGPLFAKGIDVFQLLNFGAQILLIGYLLVEWRHYLRWNKKIKELTKYEQMIYFELRMDEKNTLL